jgi:hypothetical protein
MPSAYLDITDLVMTAPGRESMVNTLDSKSIDVFEVEKEGKGGNPVICPGKFSAI